MSQNFDARVLDPNQEEFDFNTAPVQPALCKPDNVQPNLCGIDGLDFRTAHEIGHARFQELNKLDSDLNVNRYHTNDGEVVLNHYQIVDQGYIQNPVGFMHEEKITSNLNQLNDFVYDISFEEKLPSRGELYKPLFSVITNKVAGEQDEGYYAGKNYVQLQKHSNKQSSTIQGNKLGVPVTFLPSGYADIRSILPISMLPSSFHNFGTNEEWENLITTPFIVFRRNPNNNTATQIQEISVDQANLTQKKGRGRPKKHFLKQEKIVAEKNEQTYVQTVPLDLYTHLRHREAINQQNCQSKRKDDILKLEVYMEVERACLNVTLEEAEELLEPLKEHPEHGNLCALCHCRYLLQILRDYIDGIQIVDMKELHTREETVQEWKGKNNPSGSAINSETSRQRDKKYKTEIEKEKIHYTELQEMASSLKQVLECCFECFGLSLPPKETLFSECLMKRAAPDFSMGVCKLPPLEEPPRELTEREEEFLLSMPFSSPEAMRGFI